MWLLNWGCLLCRSQLPVLNLLYSSRVDITACDVRLCVRSLCCPTCYFDVVSPINCILYVCIAPFAVVVSTVWCCVQQYACGVSMVCHALSLVWLVCSCILIVFFFLFDSSLSLLFVLVLSFFLIVSLDLCCAACYLRAVFPFVQNFIMCCWSSSHCGISCCLHEYLVSGCGVLLCHWCITGLHPHRARKFPCTGSQRSPAALGEAFLDISLSFVTDYSFFPLFSKCNLLPWGQLKQTVGSKCASENISHLIEDCFITARCLNKTCRYSIDNPRGGITGCWGTWVYTLRLYPEAVRGPRTPRWGRFQHSSSLAGDTLSVAELFMKKNTEGQSATKFPASVGKLIWRDNRVCFTLITVPSLA